MLQTSLMSPASYIKTKLIKAGISQSDLKREIEKWMSRQNEEGFSFVYISDVLTEKRDVSPKFIERLSIVNLSLRLEINREYLYYLCGMWPPEMVCMDEDEFNIAISVFKT